MSFASKVKNELLKIENKSLCCDKAELCGIICFGGSVNYEDGRHILKITSENAATVRKCFELIKKIYAVSGGVDTGKSKMGRGRFSYSVSILNDEDVVKILSGLALFRNGVINFEIDKSIIENPCCLKAFIRGAFLGGGSLCAPEKAYHIEFVTHHMRLASDFAELFSAFSLYPKTVLRKSNYMIYFKGGDETGDVLNLIGAHKSLMEFMNVRILKEMRNNVNRKLNCESANLDKTLDASFLQVEAILKLKETNKFESLTPALRELAELRIANKEASLTELGNMMTPPLTKSGVNHRLKRIMEAANE